LTVATNAGRVPVFAGGLVWEGAVVAGGLVREGAVVAGGGTLVVDGAGAGALEETPVVWAGWLGGVDPGARAAVRAVPC
jgi:hypothetical protein